MKIRFDSGHYGDCESIATHFEVVRGGMLRVTKEYNIIYVPETNEWFGDVIAYGQWWDLEPDEVMQLREAYDLDALMQDYLESDERRICRADYVKAKNS